MSESIDSSNCHHPANTSRQPIHPPATFLPAAAPVLLLQRPHVHVKEAPDSDHAAELAKGLHAGVSVFVGVLCVCLVCWCLAASYSTYLKQRKVCVFCITTSKKTSKMRSPVRLGGEMVQHRDAEHGVESPVAEGHLFFLFFLFFCYFFLN